MKVALGILGAVVLSMGFYQGFGLAGIGSAPEVQGVLGGAFPTLAGVIGALVWTYAFKFK